MTRREALAPRVLVERHRRAAEHDRVVGDVRARLERLDTTPVRVGQEMGKAGGGDVEAQTVAGLEPVGVGGELEVQPDFLSRTVFGMLTADGRDVITQRPCLVALDHAEAHVEAGVGAVALDAQARGSGAFEEVARLDRSAQEAEDVVARVRRILRLHAPESAADASVVLRLTEAQLEDLSGWVAAEANHAKTRDQEEVLGEVCELLEGVLTAAKMSRNHKSASL